MAQVTIQRTEFRTHTFDIPDGIEEGSEEWDVYGDYKKLDEVDNYECESEFNKQG